MKRLLTITSGLAALAAVGALVVPAFASSARPVKSGKPAAKQTQQLTLYVFRGKEAIPGAADGKGHDTMVPSTFAIKAGVPVKVTVYNYDEGEHTITAPDLGLNVVIKAGTEFTTPPKNATPTELVNRVIPGVTHFTFTAKKAGVFRWHCSLPCDAGQNGWAMGADTTGPGKVGFMAGYIVVVA